VIFTETELTGAYVIDLEPIEDERGFFARSFCAEQFAARGLAHALPQASISYNRYRATLRGLHFQAAPHAEEKLVRCTAGAVFDVIVDLREDSPTRHRWVGLELSAQNRRALYVPQSFAHGFITLADSTELLYMMSVPYARGFERGVRWNDPAFRIEWPLEPVHIAARDATYPWVEARA